MVWFYFQKISAAKVGLLILDVYLFIVCVAVFFFVFVFFVVVFFFVDSLLLVLMFLFFR